MSENIKQKIADAARLTEETLASGPLRELKTRMIAAGLPLFWQDFVGRMKEGASAINESFALKPYFQVEFIENRPSHTFTIRRKYFPVATLTASLDPDRHSIRYSVQSRADRFADPARSESSIGLDTDPLGNVIAIDGKGRKYENSELEDTILGCFYS